MKKANFTRFTGTALMIQLVFLISCSSSVNKNQKEMNNNDPKGKYGYDVAFFSANKIETIELKDEKSKACLLLVPGYQGRVMTSTVDGAGGTSFGWINYKFIESGKPSSQFNPFGGEETNLAGP